MSIIKEVAALIHEYDSRHAKPAYKAIINSDYASELWDALYQYSFRFAGQSLIQDDMPCTFKFAGVDFYANTRLKEPLILFFSDTPEWMSEP